MISLNNLTKGVLIGLGASAVGFYMYKKNENKVDDFLNRQGIPIPNCGTRDFSRMSLEQLMETKETIEDIIAERELDEKDQVVVCQNDNAEALKKQAPEPAPSES